MGNYSQRRLGVCSGEQGKERRRLLYFRLIPVRLRGATGAAAVDVEGEGEDDEGHEAEADRAGDVEEVVPVLAEGVADHAVDGGPDGDRRQVVGEEPMVVHAAHASEEGGHAA